MNKIIVENDTMRFYSTPVPIPVGGSQWSKIFFMFSDEWEDLRKIAQFRQGELKRNVDIDSSNFCYVPNEMLPDMCGELSIVGYPQDTASAVIATANSLMLSFVQGFESGGEPAVPPTPDLYQKLLKEFAEKRQSDYLENDENVQSYIKNRPGGYMSKTQQVSITVDADNNYEGFGHIEAGVGDAISIRIDDEIKTYTVKLNEQNVKYIGMSLGPVPPTVPPADLWVLIFDDDHYTILNFDKVAHTYVVDMSVPAKFDVKYLPDSVVQPRIVYIANSPNITEEDVAEACAKISVRDVDDVSRTHQVFYDKNRQILCVSGNFGNFLERVFIKQIKMDSAKTEQVIANVFTERISGIGYLYVADVANPRRLYCVSFFVDLTGNSAIGGIAAYNCVQTLAYINNHLFAFYIDDAAYDRKLLNGNLTIKKLL